MPYKRIENALYAVISLFVGWGITSYYTSALPDFDIAANNIYTTIECEVLTFVLWGMLIFLFRFSRVGILPLSMCHKSGTGLE